MLDNFINAFKSRPALLLFDVNETLLDTTPMREAVNKAFQSEYAFQHWFSWLLHYSLVENVTNEYHDFSQIGQAVMQMTVTAFSRNIPEAKQKELVEMVKDLPAHLDVIPGLQKLQQAGYRMATLSNSPYKSSVPHLEKLGLNSFFESMLSVDIAQKFKPDLTTYQTAAAELKVNINNIMLISAHGWDIAGILRAGGRGAFVGRPGQALYPLAPAPELEDTTLLSLADKLILLD